MHGGDPYLVLADFRAYCDAQARADAAYRNPTAWAKQAILKHWGSKNAPCAERIVDRESNFQADAINSSSGTVGLFQIHPTHATWIKNKYGYAMSELTNPDKNAEVAAGLSAEAYRYYGDGWQPWRFGGKVIRGGGCPA